MSFIRLKHTHSVDLSYFTDMLLEVAGFIASIVDDALQAARVNVAERLLTGVG